MDASDILRNLNVDDLTEEQIELIRRHEVVENRLTKSQLVVSCLTLFVMFFCPSMSDNLLTKIYFVFVFFYLIFCMTYYLTGKSRLIKKLKRTLR